MEYQNTAEAMADGWSLVQYSIWDDKLSVRTPDGALILEKPAAIEHITVAGMQLAAMRL